MKINTNTIENTDALTGLKLLDSESIDCCITSPPYWPAQRNYHAGINEIGQEKTLNEYIAKLIEIYAECKRVLKTTGSMFIVIADSSMDHHQLGIPERFMIRMCDELGLLCVHKIVWTKGNAYPNGSKIKKKLSVDYEMIYHFAKTENYKFHMIHRDLSPITLREFEYYKNRQYKYNGNNLKDYKNGGAPIPGDTKAGIIRNFGRFGGTKYSTSLDVKNKASFSGVDYAPSDNKKGIERCTWRINHECSRTVHLATFPEELVKRCIEMSTDTGDIVIDPMMGVGSTCLVAAKLKRNFIGFDLNQEFVQAARERINPYLHQMKIDISIE